MFSSVLLRVGNFSSPVLLPFSHGMPFFSMSFSQGTLSRNPSAGRRDVEDLVSSHSYWKVIIGLQQAPTGQGKNVET